MKLLLVEDDPQVTRSLKQGLEEASFHLDTCATVAEARRALASTTYDVLVLDLGLPDGEGLDLLAPLRRQERYTPVLILTARDTVPDRVEGLERGGDDYLVKPFAFSELLARIRALLRRTGAGDNLIIQVANLRVDVVAREAWRGTHRLDLRPKEFDLLECLARSAGQPVSREALAESVWHVLSRATPMDNVIDVHVSHLRARIDRDFEPKLLHTVRGVGFMLGEPS